MFARSMLIAALALTASACAPKLIPGTEIQDTEDTQAIIALLNTYRTALEDRDAEKILSLVADSYRDSAGTRTPEDDLEYRELREKVPAMLNQLEDVQVDLSVRRIDVNKDTAVATFHYSTKYRMPRLKTRSAGDSDIHQMRLVKQGGTWKIVSGL